MCLSIGQGDQFQSNIAPIPERRYNAPMEDETTNPQDPLEAALEDPRGRGRPSKLTEYTSALLLAQIRKGHSNRSACRLVDIDYSTFKRWMRTGRAAGADPEYRAFYAQVMRARTERVDKLLEYAEVHAKNDPKTALALLAVYEPEMFGKPEERNINMNIRGQIEHRHEHLIGQPIPGYGTTQRNRLRVLLSRPELDEPDQEGPTGTDTAITAEAPVDAEYKELD